MNLIAALSFFIVMLVLAALPSASVALIVTRSATHGIKNGIAAAIGIVTGDVLLIALVLLGLSIIAENCGVFFGVLKYAGGAYLIWLGFSLQRAKPAFDTVTQQTSPSSLITSVLAGLLLTLGDVKAILFYASLFPSLFDLSSLTATEIAIIIALTVFSVGGVKVAYALIARRLVKKFHNASIARSAKTLAGGLLMGTGTYLIAKA